jgi:hypothetical protein
MGSVNVQATEPFSPQSTPQGGDLEEAALAMQAFQEQVTEYLNRFRTAILADLGPTPTYSPPIVVASAVVDLPNIPSNGSDFVDVTPTGSVPLGTHILSWAPTTDATSIDDLIIQILVVAANTIRVTMFNPTAGAINPDPITIQFITATAVDT